MLGVDHDLSDAEWDALQDAWGGCAYCGATGTPLQRDCVLALSRGGRYTLDNIAPACGSCNVCKCNQEVTSWLRRKRLDERAFLVRHFEVGGALRLRFGAPPRNDRSGEGTRWDDRLSMTVEPRTGLLPRRDAWQDR